MAQQEPERETPKHMSAIAARKVITSSSTENLHRSSTTAKKNPFGNNEDDDTVRPKKRQKLQAVNSNQRLSSNTETKTETHSTDGQRNPMQNPRSGPGTQSIQLNVDDSKDTGEISDHDVHDDNNGSLDESEYEGEG